MLVINIKSWEEFKSRYRSILSIKNRLYRDNSFLFRGQMNSEWKINSSFDRQGFEINKHSDLLNYFESNLRIHQHPLIEKQNYNIELLTAFAQHSGLPTRLIDWSKSPYIAAFFAFSDVIQNNFKGRLCSIYALNKNSIDIKKDKKGLQFIEIPYDNINKRLSNQLGQFTLSKHDENNLEDYLYRIGVEYKNNDSIWKFNIPISCINDALLDLDLMNINYYESPRGLSICDLFAKFSA